MNTERIKYNAPVTQALVAMGAFAQAPLGLIDVGASGGISGYWRQFEPHLVAFGFDTLTKECERLNAAESNKRINYHDYFVGWEDYESLFPSRVSADPVNGWSNQPFNRTSAYRAWQDKSMSYVQWFNNENPDVVLTGRRTSLDAFFRDNPAPIDFIKVDTDGHDYEVLCGALRLLDQRQVLGLAVEMQFHGISHQHSNTFANIDRLLREHGFSLFDLQTYRYTRAALPGHFVYALAAQTTEGQVLFGDALYLRDLPAPGYEERWGLRLSPEKLLKLVCLFEVFGLPDCAAELLLMKRSQLENDRVIDVARLQDMLACQIHPQLGSLEAVNRRFDASPDAFYPDSGEVTVLREKIPPPIRKILSAIKRKLLR